MKPTNNKVINNGTPDFVDKIKVINKAINTKEWVTTR